MESKLEEIMSKIVPKEKKARSFSDSQMKIILDSAISQIMHDPFGKFLAEKYPIKLTSTTKYSEMHDVLVEHGSPACTDGESVYIASDIFKQLLEREYYELDLQAAKATTYDEYWRAPLTDTPVSEARFIDNVVSEVIDVIAHEFTHAFNNHSKLRIAARGKSDIYRKKLDIACELQANDGIMGRQYMFSILQRQEGVTNKRLHPETINKHGLQALFDAVELNEQEKRGGGASRWSKMNDDMMKATGKDKQYSEELNQDQKQKGEKKPGASKEDQLIEQEQNIDVDERIAQELKKIGRANIKRLILESLSDKLKYDPNTDTVIYDVVEKRQIEHTYARPSKKIGMYGKTRYQVIRKGKIVKKHKEYNKTRKLTVLAVDASGSMCSQQRYVSSILDDLLKQVKEVAEKNNIEVHYENLKACLHRGTAGPIMNVTSDEWKQTMRDYRAKGGNHFSDVLTRVNASCLKKQDYDAICVINLSDGWDRLSNDDFDTKEIGKYIKHNKLKWVDAIVARNTGAITQAASYKERDFAPIREQVILEME